MDHVGIFVGNGWRNCTRTANEDARVREYDPYWLDVWYRENDSEYLIVLAKDGQYYIDTESGDSINTAVMGPFATAGDVEAAYYVLVGGGK